MRLKGVIIAAGYGTRFFPITKTVPKEMLPLVNVPAIDFIIQEFREAGIKDIVIVSHRKKKALEDLFDRDPELENHLQKENKLEQLEQIKPYSDINVAFVRQQEMKGTGDAVLAAEPFVGNSPFVVAFPDDVVLGTPGLSRQMVDNYGKNGKNVLACMEIAGDVSRYGVVAPEKSLDERTKLLSGMVEKPAPGTEPSKMISIGRYLFEPEIFEKLKIRKQKHEKGEFFLTDGIEELIGERKVASYVFEGKRLDTGKPEGYIEALLEYIYSREEWKGILIDFMREKEIL
jgi:UTP--glucose-1-phosphate uridylyltransferase